MLHQSPQSSKDYLPLIEQWQKYFTIIAPDTPGYGISDPIDQTSAMEDFATSVAEFMDAINLERTAVYGFHTGASMAVALAQQIPDRLSSVVGNGFAVLTPDERDDILENYLPPFKPVWDGSHLTWAWARLREQTIFFPWHQRNLDHRMEYDVPSPAGLQHWLVELMRSGDNYRVAYRGAFAYRGDKDLAKTGVPTLITASAQDPLGVHLDRITETSNDVEIVKGGVVDDTLNLCRDFLLSKPSPTPPPPPITRPIAGRMWNEMVSVQGGQLRVRRNTDADGMTLVVQHDAASSSDIVEPVSQSLVGKRPVLAVDLPGHGESDNTIGESDVTVDRYQSVLQQVLNTLGLDQIDFYGMWGGGLVGLEMAVQNPQRVRRLVMSNVLYHSDQERQELKDNYTPDWEPVWYGGHLLMIWHMMRDQGLFWPWFKRNREGIVWEEPFIDPEMINRRVLEVFKAPNMWRLAYQSHFDYPTHDQLQKVTVPTLLCSPKWDPNHSHTLAAHENTAGSEFMEVPPPLECWASVFLPFLEKN